MPIPRPPLLEFGGEDKFEEYLTEFGRLYNTGPVVDVLDRLVEFEDLRKDCWHVCSEEQDAYARLPRRWVQERAARVGWIATALTHPGTEVRPNFRHPERFSYILVVEAQPALGLPREFYGVVTRPVTKKRVAFVTAFPFKFEKLAQWRKGGALLYPVQEQKPKGPKKRKPR